MHKYRKYLVVLESTISLTLLKVLELIVLFLLIPFLIKKVGDVNYGTYAFMYSFILFFMNIVNYGFNLEAVRSIAKNKHNPLKIQDKFNQVLNVKFYLTIVSILIITVVGLVLNQFFPYKTLYFCAALLLVPELISLRWYFLGIEKVRLFLVFNTIGVFMYVGLILLFLKQKEQYQIIPLLESVGLFVSYLVLFVYVLKKHQLSFRWLPFNQVKKYLVQHFSSFINLLIPSIFNNIAVFIVGVLGGTLQVAYAQIAVKFVGLFTTVNAILTKAFYPFINRDFNKFKFSKNILLVIGILVSITMYLTAPFLLNIWLKSDRLINKTEILKIIKILSVMPFLTAIVSGYGVNGLLIKYKDKQFSYITIITAVLLTVLLLVFIPKFEHVGVAYGIVISKTIYALMSYLYFRKVDVSKSKFK